MYQEAKNISPNHTEEQFNLVMDAFRENIFDDPHTRDPKEYDLYIQYEIKWACIWNKPQSIGEFCQIYQKNDQYAIVIIKGVIALPDHIYRLEDLTPTDLPALPLTFKQL